jgi:hypothetical protein
VQRGEEEERGGEKGGMGSWTTGKGQRRVEGKREKAKSLYKGEAGVWQFHVVYI